MTSVFTVYGFAGSSYVRAVRIGLEEKGADHRFVDVAPGDHEAPEHLARHPFAKMPAFAHDGFELYETQAILRYLDRILPDPALTPTDPQHEARMNQIIGITDAYVAPRVSASLSFWRVFAPRFELEVDEAAVAAALPAAQHCIAEIARLMNGGPYVAGPALSLADIILVPQIDFLRLYSEGRAMLGAHPVLADWLDRMNGRDSLRRTGWDWGAPS